jgi:hypothetical protein
MPVVDVEGFGTIEFPDGTTEAQVQKWLADNRDRMFPSVEPAPPPEEPSLGGSFRRGILQLQQSIEADDYAVGLQPAEEAATDIADLERRKRQIDQPEALKEWAASDGSESFRLFAKSPVTITSHLMAEMMGTSIPSLALGGAGFLAGSVPGMVAGVGAGSFLTEYGAKIVESLGEAGIDLTNEQSLKEGLLDEKLMKEAKNAALKKGVTIGAFDAATAGLAGKFLGLPAKGFLGRGAQVGGEIGVQAAGGAGGEIAGELWATGRMPTTPEWMAEAIGEVGTGVVEVPLGLYGRGRRNAKETPPEPPNPDRPLLALPPPKPYEPPDIRGVGQREAPDVIYGEAPVEQKLLPRMSRDIQEAVVRAQAAPTEARKEEAAVEIAATRGVPEEEVRDAVEVIDEAKSLIPETKVNRGRKGQVTVTFPNAAAKRLYDVVDELKSLTKKAKNKTTTPEDLERLQKNVEQLATAFNMSEEQILDLADTYRKSIEPKVAAAKKGSHVTASAVERSTRPDIEQEVVNETEILKDRTIKDKPTLVERGLQPEETLAPDAAEAFTKVAAAQKGAPETTMLKVQAMTTRGGGALGGVVEHTGDIIHRMTHMAPQNEAGREFVKEKTQRVLAELQSGYGFGRSVAEGLAQQAKLHALDPKVIRDNVVAALKQYADAHRAIPVYNRAQWLAREAAVAVGESRIPDAIRHRSSNTPLIQ